jgi:hypothetical protein
MVEPRRYGCADSGIRSRAFSTCLRGQDIDTTSISDAVGTRVFAHARSETTYGKSNPVN